MNPVTRIYEMIQEKTIWQQEFKIKLMSRNELL